MTLRIGPIAVALGLAALGASVQLSSAQQWPPGPGAPPSPTYQSQVCQRLEGQLAAVDRGAADPGQAEQVRRYEEAAGRQQAELDRMVAQARRAGCDSGFFLFRSESPQCVELNRQTQSMRGNLDRMTVDLQRLRGGSADRGEQRRGILIALSENNCGPQYRQAARSTGFFDQLFGTTTGTPSDPNVPMGSGYRTVCVRTCDGFYFPISYSTSQEHFREDEKTCQRMCPAAEVVLFSHRNPGEDMNQATSLSGQPYTGLPNAFRYRSEFNSACSCKRPGQSWSEALGPDTTVQSGDIVVTDERAKALSAPVGTKPPAKGPAPAAATPPAAAVAAPPAANDPPAAETPDTPPAKRTVRSVGPTFIPAR
jgi:uncharacterized protein DUF2865